MNIAKPLIVVIRFERKKSDKGDHRFSSDWKSSKFEAHRLANRGER
jgi:hypothetical protein